MENKESIWSFNFTALFIANCVMFFGQFMMGTLLPKYLSALGYGSTLIGFIISMFSVTALGTRPITGPLIDGMNKKKLYLSMLCLLIIASFGYAFAANIPMLIFFRLLHGISMGCSSALALTIVTDVLPKDKLASGLGIYGLSGVFATAFGPGLGLSIADRFGYPTAFCISGVLVVISVIISSRMKIEHDADKRVIIKLSNIIAKEAVVPAYFMFLMSFTRMGFSTFLVLYITEARQIPGIAVYYFINAGALLIFRPLSGKLADKYGIHKALIPSYVFYAATLVMLAFCTQAWQLWLIGIVNALGMGTAQPFHQALCMKVVPKERRGAGSTTNFIGTDMGDLVGPTAAGAIAERFGYDRMFLALIIPIIICALSLYLWVKKHHGIPEPEIM